jgi:hypothetical protein
MLEKIRSWYLRNSVEITWFLIGWLTLAGLQDLGHGNYVEAVICFIFVAINYSMWRK